MSRKLRIMSLGFPKFPFTHQASFKELNLPESGEIPSGNTEDKLEKREEVEGESQMKI